MSHFASLPFSLLVFLGIVVPWIVVPIIQAFFFGNCDGKFGCSGGVVFAIFLSVIAGITSIPAAVSARVIIRRWLVEAPSVFLLWAGLLSGVTLAGLLLSVGSWPSIVYGALEIPALVIEWFVLSFLVCAVWLFSSGQVSNLTRRSTRTLHDKAAQRR